MKASIKNNIVTVVTDIPMSALTKGYTKPVVTDEKGNQVYRVAVSATGVGALRPIGMVVNTTIDDMAAVVIVEPDGVNVKETYAKAVVAAKKYCPIIAELVAADEAEINEAFDEVE